jgi:hypothetical protein
MEKKYYNKNKGGEAHMGREWDSDKSSTNSSNEDVANIAINKGLLFPNIGHKCLMAKEGKTKKVFVGVLGPTAHPGLPLKVFSRSRTVPTTVAKWFVSIARGTVDNIYRFRPLRNA